MVFLLYPKYDNFKALKQILEGAYETKAICGNRHWPIWQQSH